VKFSLMFSLRPECRIWPRPILSSKCTFWLGSLPGDILIDIHVVQDITFGLFRNKHGKAEFAMQVVKDAKGMTFTPDKR
jgi:hypothetical protein